MKRHSVYRRLHFHVPYKVLANSTDRVKQGSTETLLDSPVLVPTSRPVLSLLIHEKQDLVKHHLELARIPKPRQPPTARQQIPDGKIHALVKSGPGLVHSVNRLLVSSIRLSRYMVLQTNLSKGHGSAQYKLKTQSEERTIADSLYADPSSQSQIKTKSHVPTDPGDRGYPPTTPTHGRRLDTIIPCV